MQIDNYTRLFPNTPSSVVVPKSKAELIAFLEVNDKPVVVGGNLKSHGGHLQLEDDHIFLDTRKLNKIESLNSNHILTVGAGCRWEDVQNYLHQHGRAPIAQQSSFDFTIGGSIAGNIHGRDIRRSAIEESIEWIELVLADARLMVLSRTRNAAAFWSVFGSQGMLGVIARVGLRTTNNSLLAQSSVVMDTGKIPEWFEQNKDEFDLFIARPDVAGGLRSSIVTIWKQRALDSGQPLWHEENVMRDSFVFWLSTKINMFLKIRWYLEKLLASSKEVSRINAMRPPTSPLKMFTTKSRVYTYVVQEIFVPQNHFHSSIQKISELYFSDAKNIGTTIRYTSRQSSVLGVSSKTDMWAIMSFWRIRRDEQGMKGYRELQESMYNIARKAKGRVYLSYCPALSKADILDMYPEFRQLIKLKREYDPLKIFRSAFIDTLIEDEP